MNKLQSLALSSVECLPNGPIICSFLNVYKMLINYNNNNLSDKWIFFSEANLKVGQERSYCEDVMTFIQ